MEHLVRINMKLCVIPEVDLWQASVDYGPISIERIEHLFGVQIKNPWVEGAAEYLRKKGF